MARTVKTDSAASRTAKAEAADNKKAGRPQAAGKAPVGAAAVARPTQGGKSPFALQRGKLLAVRKEKPIDRLAKKDDKVKRRRKNGALVLKEIRIQQKSTEFAIPKAPFRRQVRETTADVSGKDFRWQDSALDALQTEAEAAIAQLMAEANRQTYAQRHKMLLRRTFNFTIQTMRRLGVSWIMSGPLQTEVFDMGGGLKLQQLEGPEQIRDYELARKALNVIKKRKPKKAKPAAAAADEPAADGEPEDFSEPAADDAAAADEEQQE